LLLASCATSKVPVNGTEEEEAGQKELPSHKTESVPARAINTQVSPDQDALLVSAYSLLGKKPSQVVRVNNKKFTLDCSGTVSAIFYGMGIDLKKELGSAGVEGMYKGLERKGLLHENLYPQTGDIIFWDNTWDKNDDKNYNNDPLTHTGVVVNVDEDGTIHYLHEHFDNGVIVEYMNLYRPETHKDETGKIINSAMFSGSHSGNHPDHWLSGDLWNMFGGVLNTK